MADTEAFIASGVKQATAKNGFQTGIWHQGELIGALGLHEVDRANKKTSLGYWLAQEKQGHGIVRKRNGEPMVTKPWKC